MAQMRFARWASLKIAAKATLCERGRWLQEVTTRVLTTAGGGLHIYVRREVPVQFSMKQCRNDVSILCKSPDAQGNTSCSWMLTGRHACLTWNAWKLLHRSLSRKVTNRGEYGGGEHAPNVNRITTFFSCEVEVLPPSILMKLHLWILPHNRKRTPGAERGRPLSTGVCPWFASVPGGQADVGEMLRWLQGRVVIAKPVATLAGHNFCR